MVAEGAADVYPRHGRTMEWDTAAGHAVLAAAGLAIGVAVPHFELGGDCRAGGAAERDPARRGREQARDQAMEAFLEHPAALRVPEVEAWVRGGGRRG